MKAEPTPTFDRVLAAILGALFVVSLGGFTYSNYLAERQAGGTPAAWMFLLNTLILAIPLGLLYGATGLLVIAARQHAAGPLQPRLAKLLYWSPRIAGIVIILFISLFALDVFEAGYSPGELAVALLMHLLPSIALALVLALAWRWPWIGFVAFLLAALFFMRFLLREPLQNFGIFLLFCGPLLLIALLFGLNWRWRNDLQPA